MANITAANATTPIIITVAIVIIDSVLIIVSLKFVILTLYIGHIYHLSLVHESEIKYFHGYFFKVKLFI
jgi:hypothetical protein